MGRHRLDNEFFNSLTASGPASAIAAFRDSTFALGDGTGWGPGKARRATAMFATYGVPGFDLVREVSSTHPDIAFGLASVGLSARVFLAGEEVSEHRLDDTSFDRGAAEDAYLEVELIEELEAAIRDRLPGRAPRPAGM